MDATIEATVESDDKEVSRNLFIRHLQRGEEMENGVSFRIPSDIQPGDYNLLLTVNGVTSASWSLKIKQ